MKKIMLALLMAICLNSNNDCVPKERVFEYVAENISVLSTFPYDTYIGSTNDETSIAFIQDVLGQDTIVKDVYQYSPSILQFYCGGTGIVASSTYSGFYYSEDDVPYAFEFESEAQFTRISDDVYEWQSDDCERAVYTERILPYWFWYQQVWN